MEEIMKTKDRLNQILGNKERFSYKSEKIRRINPVHLLLCYKMVGVWTITFNVKERTVDFSYLPAGQSIVLSLESFEHFLNFISSHDFSYGCDIDEYTSDGTLINLLIEDEIEENILTIKKDHTEIFLNREDICKINTQLLYGILGKIKNFVK